VKPGTVLVFSPQGKGALASVQVTPPVEPVRAWTEEKRKAANVK